MWYFRRKKLFFIQSYQLDNILVTLLCWRNERLTDERPKEWEKVVPSVQSLKWLCKKSNRRLLMAHVISYRRHITCFALHLWWLWLKDLSLITQHIYTYAQISLFTFIQLNTFTNDLSEYNWINKWKLIKKFHFKHVLLLIRLSFKLFFINWK